MEGKTFYEISIEHGIRESEISLAVKNERGHIRPVGQKCVPTCNRALRTWNEREVLEAVARIWKRRADNYSTRAAIWEDKATRLLQGTRS